MSTPVKLLQQLAEQTSLAGAAEVMFIKLHADVHAMPVMGGVKALFVADVRDDEDCRRHCSS